MIGQKRALSLTHLPPPQQNDNQFYIYQRAGNPKL